MKFVKGDCAFCHRAEIKEDYRMICEPKEEPTSYAFVPLDPEIFGHVIVTVESPCIREICEEDGAVVDVLRANSSTLWKVAMAIRRIPNVERVYVATLGEDNLHIHHHLLPRYFFCTNDEIERWENGNRFQSLDNCWDRFYSKPTEGFHDYRGFRYLGEIERTYELAKKRIMRGPNRTLVSDMARRLSLFLNAH